MVGIIKKALPRESSRSRATLTFNSPPHRKWESSRFIRYQMIPDGNRLLCTSREILQSHAARLSSRSAAAWISSSVTGGGQSRLMRVMADPRSARVRNLGTVRRRSRLARSGVGSGKSTSCWLRHPGHKSPRLGASCLAYRRRDRSNTRRDDPDEQPRTRSHVSSGKSRVTDEDPARIPPPARESMRLTWRRGDRAWMPFDEVVRVEYELHPWLIHSES